MHKEIIKIKKSLKTIPMHFSLQTDNEINKFSVNAKDQKQH